jgi:hypothetical protein
MGPVIRARKRGGAALREVARECVGAVTLIAERGYVKSRAAWRLRVLETGETIDCDSSETQRRIFVDLILGEYPLARAVTLKRILPEPGIEPKS